MQVCVVVKSIAPANDVDVPQFEARGRHLLLEHLRHRFDSLLEHSFHAVQS